MPKRSMIGLASVAALAVMLAGCTGGAGNQDTGKQEVSIRLSNDIDSLDPVRAAVGDGIAAGMFAYDTLVASVKGKIESQLATKWTVGASDIVLQLRSGVTCADGSKMTADVYAENIKRFIDPKAPSKDVATVFGDGQVTVVPDTKANTLEIRLSKPFGGLLTGLTRVPMVCQAGLDDPNALTSKTFGSGPYVLSEAVTGDHYTYTKRAGYDWGPDGATNAQSPDKVVLRVITSDTTAANLLLSDQLDIAAVTGADRERLNATKGMTEKLVTPSLWHLMFNEKEGNPTADENVRLALAEVINRADLARAAGGSTARLASTFLTPDAQCYSAADAKAIPKEDLSAAKAALAKAGYGPGGKTLSLRLVVFNALPGAADYLLDAFKKLGIDVKSRVVDGNELGKILLETFDWDVTVANTFPTDPIKASGYVSGAFPPDGANHTFIQNPTYDSLSAQARTQPTSTQCGKWIPADRALFERVDLVPLYWEDVATYSKRYDFDPVGYLTAGIHPTSIVKR